MKKIGIIIILFMMAIGITNAQVGIYPRLIFIDGMTKSAYVKIFNHTDEQKEVFLTYQFVIDKSDSNAMKIKTPVDSALEKKYTLDPYLKLFPKRLTLKANAEMMVRFLVMHPNDLPDGTYITKLKVRSKKLDTQVDTTNADTKNLHISMELASEIVTLVCYQKGVLTTNAEISNIATSEDSTHFNINLGMKQSGNSPFWGNLICAINDAEGHNIDTISNPFALYCDQNEKVKIKKSKLTAGKKYKVAITIDTNRDAEIPGERIIKKEPIYKNIEFTYPEGIVNVVDK